MGPIIISNNILRKNIEIFGQKRANILLITILATEAQVKWKIDPVVFASTQQKLYRA